MKMLYTGSPDLGKCSKIIKVFAFVLFTFTSLACGYSENLYGGSLTEYGISFLIDATWAPDEIAESCLPFKLKDNLRWRYLSIAMFIPYDRGNIYLINPFTPDGMKLGEDYITYNLGSGALLKLGTFRSSFGKDNIYHLHQLNFTSHPIAYYRFFGSEGLKVNGGQLSYLMPTDIYWEVGYEYSVGNLGVFRYGAVNHFYSKWSLAPSDESELSIGLSYVAGPKRDGTKLKVSDISLSYRFLPYGRRLYRDLGINVEYMWDTDEPEIYGGYFEIFGKFGQRDVVLAYRYDQFMDERYHTLSYTLQPSEFQKYRLQLIYDTGDKKLYPGIQVMMLFQLGQHPAHNW